MRGKRSGSEGEKWREGLSKEANWFELEQRFEKGAQIQCVRPKYFHRLATEGLRAGRGQSCPTSSVPMCDEVALPAGL